MQTQPNSKMYADQLETQMRKGSLVYCVLLICRGGHVYSSEIISRLQGAGLAVVEGTIYPLLNRLQKDGLLLHEWKESAQGPPRKYYRISVSGIMVLQELKRANHQLQSAINAIEKE